MADAPSRGYRGIEEVMKRVGPLADWTRQFKPGQQHLTLERRDYDLIKRWPKAAHAHEVSVTREGQELWYRGLELTFDGGPRRYERPKLPAQVDIEELTAR